MVFGQIWRTQNRREQIVRSNLRGASAPPPPWRPWTRGGTLLPSRGRPRKKKKKEAALSPPLSRWRRNAVGARIMTAIYINNLATVNTNFLCLYAAV